MSHCRIIAARSHIALTLGIAAALGGCATPGIDDLGSVAQADFLSDLGSAIGSPIATGSTIGLTPNFSVPCASSSAPQASYLWIAPASGRYIFTTFGSGFDTVLQVIDASTLQSLSCNDDSGGTLQSAIPIVLSAGKVVVVSIGGFSTSAGSYQLNVHGPDDLGAIPGNGMQLWLRADIPNPLAGRIATWHDSSGSGHNASMPTASRQPLIVGGVLNGHPVARFSGAQSMSLDVPVTPTQFTVFVAGKNLDPNESPNVILGPSGDAPNNQLRWENGSQALFVGTSNDLPVITASIGNTRVYHVLSARYDGATLTVYRDGNPVSSSSFTTTGPWTLNSVGSWYSSLFLHGDLAEMMIYDRPLPESERLGLNAYLRDRYSLP